jgi:hypothetical protein
VRDKTPCARYGDLGFSTNRASRLCARPLNFDVRRHGTGSRPSQAFITGTDTKRQVGTTTIGAAIIGAATSGAATIGAATIGATGTTATGATTTPVRMKDEDRSVGAAQCRSGKTLTESGCES